MDFDFDLLAVFTIATDMRVVLIFSSNFNEQKVNKVMVQHFGQYAYAQSWSQDTFSLA